MDNNVFLGGVTVSHPAVAAKLFGTPLMVEPSRGAAMIRTFLARSASVPSANIRFEGAEPTAQLYGSSRGGQRRYQRVDNIAVISIEGALSNKISWIEDICGMTSYTLIGAAIADALADDRVDGILLEIDSPGGEVSGVFDLADSIREAKATKPIWASLNDMACSAAYLIAAACDRIYLPQNGCVGSIGAVAMHMDVSKMYEAAGVDVTIVEAGAKKAWMTPHRPLDEEAHTWLQGRLDTIRNTFVANVADWRGLDASAVSATEAGVFYGTDGVDNGLADGILTFDDAFATFADYLASGDSDMALFGSTRRGAQASATTDQPQPEAAATDAPAAVVETPAPAATVEQPKEQATTSEPAAPAVTVEALVQVAIAEAVRSVGMQAAAAQLTRIGAEASIAQAIKDGLSVEAFRQQTLTALAADTEANAPSALPQPAPGLSAGTEPQRPALTAEAVQAKREQARRERLAGKR